MRELSPAYFGLVMATGIVSLAADMLGHPLLGPVHTIFARCVAIKKGQALGAKRSWGAAPVRLGNAANGPCWSQPEGKACKTALLVVAFLAKAPALASSRA